MDIDIPKLRQLLEKATPGEWTWKQVGNFNTPGCALFWPDNSKGGMHYRRLDSNGGMLEADAEFISTIKRQLPGFLSEITSLRKQLEEAKRDQDWRPLLSAPLDGTYVELLIWHHNHFKAPENQKENWEKIVKAQWIDFNGGGWTWSGMSGSPQGWRPYG